MCYYITENMDSNAKKEGCTEGINEEKKQPQRSLPKKITRKFIIHEQRYEKPIRATSSRMDEKIQPPS